MTAIEQWVSDMVKVALGGLQFFDPGDVFEKLVSGQAESGGDGGEVRRLTEQRIACLLVQARALECRHIAGELLIKCGGQTPAIQLAGWLTERSRKLEAVALELAKVWPIPEPEHIPPQSGLILVKN